MALDLDAYLALAPTHPFSYIQIIGYAAMLIGITAFLQKDDTRLKLFMATMAVVIVFHFSLLGAFVAAVSATLAGSRALLTLNPYIMKNRHIVAAAFILLTTALSLYTYTRPLDILPFITATLGTFALFYLRGIEMRWGFVFIGTIWLIHNILAHSYGPAIMEIFILSANLITIHRLKQNQKSRPT